MKYYLAPMEGITGYVYRNSYRRFFNNVDKYFTPFIVPNESKNLNTKEFKDVLPEKEYEVVWIDSDFANQYDAWFTIKCENGKEKGLRKHAKGYRGRVA